MAYPNRRLPPLTAQLIRRFWKHVAIAQPDDCWLWTGHIHKRSGYGVFIINDLAWRVHRVAYAIHFGVEPDQMPVCHRCDVRNCCNPAHLFMGTTQDNTRDMKEKGRAASGDRSPARIHIEDRPRGEKHYLTKLTEAKVIAMRGRYAQGGVTCRQVADQFGTTLAVAKQLIGRRTWKHI